MKPLAVVTGTTHGIGRVTALELARAGLHVVMLCRNPDAAAQVRSGILAQLPDATVDVLPCDLADLTAVRGCAARLRRDFGPVQLLVNNAGTVSMRHRLSTDGFELVFATNHLGPFLLTALLRERMAAAGRIVTVASCVHFRGRLDLDAIDAPGARYRPAAAYARSKLANVLHTLALARRLAGSGVTVNCLHPGIVATNLLPRWLELVRPLFRRVIFDATRGARTTLQLALSPDVAGVSGAYFDEQGIPRTPSPLALDQTLQDALWERSLRWTGLSA